MGQAGGEAKLEGNDALSGHGGVDGAGQANREIPPLPPAHRERGSDGRESLTARSRVIWDEAENRLHAQKSVLLWCFGKLG